ncbi:class II histocompatibility antigen, B-L beta chain-like isoform X1 [Labrus mixtus]|uniref:class II histocompatibility antigen, B-L beta chain-like isoform X1 n=1 Tax=Labrus mixtus TaxID=508554 RepID=UPI0029BFE475|nr:class II histocompatibility antigen, B-L beta chain-like isoform X1 [Labrus mixtus]
MRLFLLYRLTVSAVLLWATPTGGYVYQAMYDCEYGEDDLSDMVFLVKNVFNKEIVTLYDSRVGKYVGFGEMGMRNADHYNSQRWKMELRKIQVEIVCRYNAKYYQRSIRDRKVPPVVRVRQTEPADYGEQSVLECSVLGFFPQEVRVRWLRDGVEVTSDVSSSDIMANGDWSFQVHSFLELIPRRGERVTCRVDHSSLQKNLDVDWDTYPLDAKRLKKTLGITSFCFGFSAAVFGAAYYWWKKRSDFSPLRRQDPTSPEL